MSALMFGTETMVYPECSEINEQKFARESIFRHSTPQLLQRPYTSTQGLLLTVTKALLSLLMGKAMLGITRGHKTSQTNKNYKICKSKLSSPSVRTQVGTQK